MELKISALLILTFLLSV